MNKEKAEEKGKFISLLLRHNPAEFNLSIDLHGWAKIEDVLRICEITTEELNFIVENNDKKRYEFNADKDLIRACQGHSIKVDLGFTAITPPSVLYHGTADRFLEEILIEGLIPQARQYVHLSVDIPTALNVGARHGKVVVLLVDSKKMFDDGLSFYQSTNGVWLTEKVPAKYLKVL